MVEFAAYTICLLLIGISVFQILLALGKSLGEYAWGGQYKVLPNKLRIASLINIFVYFTLCLIALNGAGIISILNDSATVFTMWVQTIYLLSAVLLNLASRSKKERYTFTPLALILFVCSLIISLN